MRKFHKDHDEQAVRIHYCYLYDANFTTIVVNNPNANLVLVFLCANFRNIAANKLGSFSILIDILANLKKNAATHSKCLYISIFKSNVYC